MFGRRAAALMGVSAAFAVAASTLAMPATAVVGQSRARDNLLPGTTCPVFPADNYWNTRIDRLPIDPRSDEWMSHMHSSINLHPDFGPSPGGQAAPYGIPITVIKGSPRIPVTFQYASESDRVDYPLSSATVIEGGPDSDGDRHAIVVDATTCELFETWDTRKSAGGWTAGSGAVWDLTSNVLRRRGWTSADAAGLPILPGLLRWDEVSAHAVDHAIRFTTNVTRRAFIWPARHQAGSTNDPSFPPMGARFRLAADYPLDSLSPEAAAIVVALKHYGLVLADNGSPWYFQGAADERWPNSLLDELKAIPANAFEAVDTGALRVSGSSAATRP